MAVSAKLAELYVELSAKGDVNKVISDLNNRLGQTNQLMTSAERNSTALFGSKMRSSLMDAHFASQIAAQSVGYMQSGPGKIEMGSMAKASADLQMSGDQTKVLEMKAVVDYQASPEGKRFLAQQLDVKKQMAKLNAADQWQKLVAEQGKFGAGLTMLEKKIGGFGDSMLKMYSVSDAAMVGLVAAASPVAFSTFTGSLHLLSAEIGQIFIPWLMKFSGTLQDVAFWFESLDGTTKGTIASIAVWTSAALLAGGAAIKLFSTYKYGRDKLIEMNIVTKASAMNMSLLGTASTKSAVGVTTATVASGRLATVLGLIPAAASRAASSLASLANSNTVAGLGMAAGVMSAIQIGHSLAEGNYNQALHQYADSGLGPIPGGGHLSAGAAQRAAAGGAQRPNAGATGQRPILTSSGGFQSIFYSIEQQWRRLQGAGASMMQLEEQNLRLALQGNTTALEQNTGALQNRPAAEPQQNPPVVVQ